MATEELEAPGRVLARALAFRDRLQYDRVVALCDPSSVESCHHEFMESLRAPTTEELRVRHPEFDAAKIQAIHGALSALRRDEEGRIISAIAGVRSRRELEALAPRDFLQRLLEGADIRSTIVRRLRERSRPVPHWLTEPLGDVRYDVDDASPIEAGEVTVQFRMISVTDGAAVGEPTSETLVRGDDGRWRLRARRNLLETRGAFSFVVPAEFADLFVPT